MKILHTCFTCLVLLIALALPVCAIPDSGFFLPDSVNEMRLRYKTVDNLIILPVKINDSLEVNLILDTGCRNVVLFGKRFQKLFALRDARHVQFSGLGSGKPVSGFVVISNHVAIQEVLGEEIPIIIVAERNVFKRYANVDGVIGFEIFYKFEIELNPQTQTITFRPALRTKEPIGYTRVNLSIVDCRPVIQSHVVINNERSRPYDLIIDTGSIFGLLIKTTDADLFDRTFAREFNATGFNGRIEGYQLTADKVNMDGYILRGIETGVIESPWHNHATLGMSVLKDYILVINYLRGYVCFKSITRA